MTRKLITIVFMFVLLAGANTGSMANTWFHCKVHNPNAQDAWHLFLYLGGGTGPFLIVNNPTVTPMYKAMGSGSDWVGIDWLRPETNVVEAGQYCDFDVATAGPGPIVFISGYWSDEYGNQMGVITPADIQLTPLVPAGVPTLSQWVLILFAFMLLAVGSVYILKTKDLLEVMQR
ncbi:MAG: hypothetical protein WCO44_15035 [Bacteroidota bacterium]